MTITEPIESHRMKGFEADDGVIKDLSSMNKGRLVFRDCGGHDGFDEVG